ncbi:MAG: TonB family protein [Terracidiphilus sp.]|jgi:protein TonB
MKNPLEEPEQPMEHRQRVLVLERHQDSVAVSAAGSLMLHGALFGTLLFYGVISGLFHHNLWGNPGEGGAIQVTLVSNAIPLPHEEQNQNVLMTETQSKAPAPPEPKAKEAVDESAIPISGKDAKPKLEPARKTQPKQPPPQPDNRAHFGEQSGSALPRATMAQPNASNGPVSITNGDFGSRFGWYVEVIKRKVGQNWNKYEVDAGTHKGAVAEIYFRVNRQGTPTNFKISKPSGSASLDQSCLRATQRVDTFGDLPRDSNDQWLDVTYDCTY